MTIAHHHAVHSPDREFRLRMALILTAIGMVIEFAGGFLSNSLALISDAGHMLTHLFALGMSYFAILLSSRPATKTRTYGFYRAEVLAAFINGIVLIFVAGYIVYEAVARFLAPEEIRVGEMLFVAVFGLAINGVSTVLLAKVSHGDLNIKSAFIHEIGDMISSVAVVAAGIVIFYTKNYAIDPLLSFLICALIVIWAARLLIESANILLEATPKHFDIDEVTRIIKSEIKDVREVHHVHAWSIASSLYAMAAHVVLEDCQISQANEILDKINKLVKEKFHIAHTNIQFECLVRPAPVRGAG